MGPGIILDVLFCVELYIHYLVKICYTVLHYLCITTYNCHMCWNHFMNLNTHVHTEKIKYSTVVCCIIIVKFISVIIMCVSIQVSDIVPGITLAILNILPVTGLATIKDHMWHDSRMCTAARC
jgi:hypothetical protein